MAKAEISTKRLAISKANAQMVAIVAAASFVTVFCLIASKAVLGQNQYQSRLTSAKEKAHRQLVANLKNFDGLKVSYKQFDAKDPNVLGGSRTGTGDNDGSNSKLVLDALPSTYDFPALTSSLEKILKDNSLSVSSISGTDDQVAQQGNSSSPTPTPVEMPFSFSVTHADYGAVARLITSLEHSIRPIQVDTILISGGTNNMTVTINAHTYFQPGKSVDIKEQVQK